MSSDPARAKHGVALIKGLFRVERSIKNAPRKKREEARREESRPIVDAFFAWCDEQAADVLDETPIARAIRYAQNRRAALTRFLDDGRLPLDSNVSERNLLHERLDQVGELFRPPLRPRTS
ncbi:IS66 family transposase [Nannocystis radixulma]|uniref:Transposase n=1 Tax=Nannocystis radixulma TaxID=2995305 RepID=A0ABT5BKT9_9BACT|nr:transposase [Nannocystis radixulma]MDC0674765.1 transposase [Nannocystis radixulma]